MSTGSIAVNKPMKSTEKYKRNSDSPIQSDSEVNKTITEEEDDEDNHSQQVAKFLQDLQSDNGLSNANGNGLLRDKNGGSPSNNGDANVSANKLMGFGDKNAPARNGNGHNTNGNGANIL